MNLKVLFDKNALILPVNVRTRTVVENLSGVPLVERLGDRVLAVRSTSTPIPDGSNWRVGWPE